ncbi:hypothetical protein DICVIV_11582 [Dictyocaulus viviparus]|uniref:Uncharacterized protein n=1 Tax=Dictyocaulus viviparus TaxID=29172 RepID=A0A0D8XCT0_DICVI|nr:hypothetical protein DICVIV_11582 [Dictyocaulus viviparus]
MAKLSERYRSDPGIPYTRNFLGILESSMSPLFCTVSKFYSIKMRWLHMNEKIATLAQYSYKKPMAFSKYFVIYNTNRQNKDEVVSVLTSSIHRPSRLTRAQSHGMDAAVRHSYGYKRREILAKTTSKDNSAIKGTLNELFMYDWNRMDINVTGVHEQK